MSHEGSITVNGGETTHMLDYKDGQLQIVEVSPYDKSVTVKDNHEVILPDMREEASSRQELVQAPTGSDKSLMNLDLMQFTLVRGPDGEESYRLETNTNSSEELGNDSSLTYILQSSDEGGDDDTDQWDSYVMVEGEEGPLFMLRSSVEQPEPTPAPEKKLAALTPAQILERAKMLQKQRPPVTETGQPPPARRGRKRKGDLPPPHELLSSPNFRLYLYSCKHCDFKCNAVKELKAHRTAEHGAGARQRGAPAASALQCARCPFRGDTQKHLMKHVNEKHLPEAVMTITGNKISLDSKEVEEADILVCGACGFESARRDAFREHIERVHGACIA